MARGSIIFKILIVVFIAVLWQVIYIPGKIWKEENSLEKVDRKNMNAIYEAENYYYNKTKKFVPSDSLENLLAFINADSSLQQKRQIGELTHILTDSIDRVLEIPVLSNIVPISESISEMNGDLDFNTRYFEKYPEILNAKNDIKADLRKFDGTIDFPNFCAAKTFVDSLKILKDRINEYSLQNSTLLVQRYIDSLSVYLPKIELAEVQSYWKSTFDKTNQFIKAVNKTDIASVSSVGTRLNKFIDRANTGMTGLQKSDLNANLQMLSRQRQAVAGVHEHFIKDYFLLTQKRGILQLNEVDSVLVKFNESNFYSPDTFDGKNRYLVHYTPGKNNIIVESPNLLNRFQDELKSATAPVQNLSIFPMLTRLDTSLSKLGDHLDKVKTDQRLSRYSTELLLNVKELTAELKDLSSVRFYRYASGLKTFIDTVQTERRFSALKPLIEDIRNPMDTLAVRLENKNIADLEKRMEYFAGKIVALDSMIDSNNKIPGGVRNSINFWADFENAKGNILNDLKSAMNPADGEKLRQAGVAIDKSTDVILNGYHEPVYGIFFSKKHKNHGYIENGQKSWENQQ